MKKFVLMLAVLLAVVPVNAQRYGGYGRGEYGHHRDNRGGYGQYDNRDPYGRYGGYGDDYYYGDRFNRDHGYSLYGDVPYGFDFWTGGDMLLGWMTTEGNMDVMELRARNSVEIGVPDLIGFSWNTPFYEFAFGAGIMNKTFKTKSGLMYYKDMDGNLGIGTVPAGAYRDKSKISVRSVTLFPTFSLNLGYAKFTAGPIFNFNVAANTITKYTVNGSREKEYGGRLHCRPVTVDLYLGLKWSGAGVYVKYSPKGPLDPSYNPDFSVFSFGLVI